MDFDYAAELAVRISRGENSKLHKQLLTMCIPYFLRVKIRFGFDRISDRDVVEQLAHEAIADTIVSLKNRKVAFWVLLQNAFRKCCRQRYRQMYRPSLEELMKRCGILGPRSEQPAPDVLTAKNDECELICRELHNHGESSRTTIYERMRGSSYKEIGVILGKTAHQSRALFRYNVNKIRDSLRRRHAKDEGR